MLIVYDKLCKKNALILPLFFDIVIARRLSVKKVAFKLIFLIKIHAPSDMVRIIFPIILLQCCTNKKV